MAQFLSGCRCRTPWGTLGSDMPSKRPRTLRFASNADSLASCRCSQKASEREWSRWVCKTGTYAGMHWQDCAEPNAKRTERSVHPICCYRHAGGSEACTPGLKKATIRRHQEPQARVLRRNVLTRRWYRRSRRPYLARRPCRTGRRRRPYCSRRRCRTRRSKGGGERGTAGGTARLGA